MNVVEIFFLASLILFNTDLSCCTSTKVSDLYRKNFDKWKKIYRKSYNENTKSDDEAFQNFSANKAFIDAHNKLDNQTYKCSTSSHSDMSFDEIKNKRTGLRASNVKSLYPKLTAKDFAKKKLKFNSVNYTETFPPIKNQMDCGASWSFSTLSILEFWLRVGDNNLTLSQQNVIDCDTMSNGCEGGWPTDALRYAHVEGISNGLFYKYKAKTRECQRTRDKFPPAYKIPNACELKLKGNENLLVALLTEVGPVAGKFNSAITEGFTNYKSGIFNDPTCSKKLHDHSIAIVGFGTDEELDVDYWIVRNSWGTSWGMRGYGLMARNMDNLCGIASFAIFPC